MQWQSTEEIMGMHPAGRWSIGEDLLRSGQVGRFADPEQTLSGAYIDECMSSVGGIGWLVGSGAVQELLT